MSADMAKAGKRQRRLGAPVLFERSSALMVRVKDAHRRAFVRRAEVHGLSVSAWARMILLRQLTREERENGESGT
jgi:hypothetical protein